jgi:hypothetical protein
MYRTDAAGHVANKYDNGDPTIPREATIIDATHLNAIQEELAGTVEGLGGTLNKADNGQLLSRLNATYGRLGTTNTWTLAQTFSGNVSVGGTFGATGNASLGGGLSVTASTTLTGPLTANGTTRVNASVGFNATPGTFGFDYQTAPTGDALARWGSNMPLVIRSGSTNTPGLGFNMYANSGNQRVVSGYASEMLQVADGTIRFSTGGTGAAGAIATLTEKVRIGSAAPATPSAPQNSFSVLNGYIAFASDNPNSNVAFQNTITPRSTEKVSASITTSSSGQTIVDGLNVTGVSLVPGTSNQVLRITFAAGFSTSNYQVSLTPDAGASGANMFVPGFTNKTSTSVDVRGYILAGGGAVDFNTGVIYRFDIRIVGAQ